MVSATRASNRVVYIKPGQVYTSGGKIVSTQDYYQRLSPGARAVVRRVQARISGGRAPVVKTRIQIDDKTGKQKGLTVFRGSSAARPTEATTIRFDKKGKVSSKSTIRGIPDFIKQRTDVGKPAPFTATKIDKASVAPILKGLKNRFDAKPVGDNTVEITSRPEEIDRETSSPVTLTTLEAEPQEKIQQKLPSGLITAEKEVSKIEKFKRKLLGRIQKGKAGSGVQETEAQLQSALFFTENGKARTLRLPKGDAIRIATELFLGTALGIGTAKVFSKLIKVGGKVAKTTKVAGSVGTAGWVAGVPFRAVATGGDPRNLLVEFAGDVGFLKGSSIGGAKLIDIQKQKLSTKQSKNILQSTFGTTKPKPSQLKTTLKKVDSGNKAKIMKAYMQINKEVPKVEIVIDKVHNLKRRRIGSQKSFFRMARKEAVRREGLKGKKRGVTETLRKIQKERQEFLEKTEKTQKQLRKDRITRLKQSSIDRKLAKKLQIRADRRDGEIVNGKRTWLLGIDAKGKPIRTNSRKKWLTQVKELAKRDATEKSWEEYTRELFRMLKTQNTLVKQNPKEFSKEALAIMRQEFKIILKGAKEAKRKTSPQDKVIEKINKDGTVTVLEQPKLQQAKVQKQKTLQKTAQKTQQKLVTLQEEKVKVKGETLTKQTVLERAKLKLMQLPRLNFLNKGVLNFKRKVLTQTKSDTITKNKQKSETKQFLRGIPAIKTASALRVDQLFRTAQTPAIRQAQSTKVPTSLRLSPIAAGIPFKKLNLKLKKRLAGASSTLLKKKKKGIFIFQYTPTLAGIGKTIKVSDIKQFTGFEVRGSNIIIKGQVKPVKVKKYTRSRLKNTNFVRKHRRRKPIKR